MEMKKKKMRVACVRVWFEENNATSTSAGEKGAEAIRKK
jgi:hypothetical protein